MLFTRLNFILAWICFMQVYALLAQSDLAVATPLMHEPSKISQKEVVDIIKDRFGFIWFATTDGLIRYDGHDMKTYKENPLLPGSLGDNFIKTIAEDSIGNLWLGAGDGKLYKYHQRADRFEVIPHLSTEKSSEEILQIFIDTKGGIWLATVLGLEIVNPINNKREHVFDEGDILHNAYISLISEDQEGRCWIATAGRGLMLFDPVSEEVISIDETVVEGAEEMDGVVNVVHCSKDGHVWIADNRRRLYRLNWDQRRLTTFQLHGIGEKKHFMVMEIEEGENDDLWLGSRTDGIIHFFPSTQEVSHYIHDNANSNSISSNSIGALFMDSEQTLWVGYNRKGVDLLHTDHNGFSLLPINTGDIAQPNFHCIMEATDGRSWIGTMGNGIFVFDPNTKQTTSLMFERGDPHQFRYNMIWDIVEGNDGDIWVATHRGLINVRQDDKSYTIFNRSHGLREYAIRSLHLDQQGQLWIGNFGGFNVMDTYTKDIMLVDTYFDNPFQIFLETVEDRQGYMWVSVFSDGVYRIDPTTKTSQHYKKEIGNLRALSSNIVSKVIQDQQERIWIATQGGGLCLLVEEGDSTFFRHWRTYNSEISDDDINDMFMTDEGMLWLITSSGLNSFDFEQQQFKTYQLPNFSQGLTLFARLGGSGLLYAGDANQIILFNPDSIKRNDEAPSVFITNFELNGQSVPIGSIDTSVNHSFSLNESILFTEVMELAHWQNDLTFEFAALNYLQPGNNQYKFKLEGYDEKWLDTDAWNRRIRYTNLSPSTYQFNVIASNNDGVWNDVGKSIQIHIAFPWWQTWWAYLLYGITIFGVVRGLYVFQLNRKLAISEAKRLKELDHAKSRLYTNVTHEFRTPITVILGMIEKIQEDPNNWISEGVRAIERSAQQLLNLVNQMLDLAKIDAGSYPFYSQQINIIPYLSYLVESYQSLANAKKIELLHIKGVNTLVMDTSTDLLTKIIYNLLSNAIKYTPEGGKVEVFSFVKNDTFFMHISDSGIGIPTDEIPHIFDRFYQVDSAVTRANEGTGIGLALVKELVDLLNGKISVHSKEKTGTTFIVELPITHHVSLAGDLDYTSDGPTAQPIAQKSSSIFRANGKEKKDMPVALIIEDNPDVITYIVSCLEKKYQLHTATNGKQGVEVALEYIPDIIISDVMMPEMDGYTLCNSLKLDKRTSHIPVVLLTAKVDEDSRLKGWQKGADAYLGKPFRKAELEAIMQNLMELRQELQQKFSQFPAIPTEKMLESHQAEHEFLQKFKQHVLMHLNDEKFSIPQLCEEMGISRSQLHRKLKALTNKSTSHVIRTIRLEKGKELILTTQSFISEIAFKVGFSNSSYFSTAFTEEFGLSPSEMRQKSDMQQ